MLDIQVQPLLPSIKLQLVLLESPSLKVYDAGDPCLPKQGTFQKEVFLLRV